MGGQGESAGRTPLGRTPLQQGLHHVVDGFRHGHPSDPGIVRLGEMECHDPVYSREELLGHCGCIPGVGPDGTFVLCLGDRRHEDRPGILVEAPLRDPAFRFGDRRMRGHEHQAVVVRMLQGEGQVGTPDGADPRKGVRLLADGPEAGRQHEEVH